MKIFPDRWISSVSLTFTGTAMALLLYLAGVPFLDLIELKTYDLRIRSRKPPVASPAVALAVIDEKSLNRMGRWPWPREKIAVLVNRLNAAGAAVVGLTISFVEPEEVAGKTLALALRGEMAAEGLPLERVNAIINASRKKA